MPKGEKVKKAPSLKIDTRGSPYYNYSGLGLPRVPTYYLRDLLRQPYGPSDKMFSDFFDDVLFLKRKKNAYWENNWGKHPYFQIQPIVRRFSFPGIERWFDYQPSFEIEDEDDPTLHGFDDF